MFDDSFAPNKCVPIRIDFDLGDILFFDEKLKYGGEYSFKHVFHALRTKAVNGAEVRALSSG
ncbi:hypothetical protein UB51_14185 [Paenibacillus sp. IHBB 10380]|nr:hypothetical protein UB51_14185 [Paenibacillus sp. IHBB 10380]